MGSPEAMEQFHENELGTITDGAATRRVFVDGWGHPIMWFRCAPGYSNCTDPDFVKATGIIYKGISKIQTGIAQAYPIFNEDGSPMMVPQLNPDGTITLVQAKHSCDHDPFDTRNADMDAFHLIPLIYSAGPDGQYGLNRGSSYRWAATPVSGCPFESSVGMTRGDPTNKANDNTTDAVGCHFDNITNHSAGQ
jgi:hypothetical protein